MAFSGGIAIDGVHSLDDMGLILSAKSVTPPERKSVRVTVPYMSGSYDFSDACGYVAYEDRELSVGFDLIADDPQALESELTDVLAWLNSAQESAIVDDDYPGYHFTGTLSACDVDYGDAGDSATVSAEFIVYPFRICDANSTATVSVGQTVISNEGQRCKLLVTPTDSVTIEVNDVAQTFTAEAYADFYLESGDNTIVVTSGSATLTWNVEVF